MLSTIQEYPVEKRFTSSLLSKIQELNVPKVCIMSTSKMKARNAAQAKVAILRRPAWSSRGSNFQAIHKAVLNPMSYKRKAKERLRQFKTNHNVNGVT